MLVHTVLRQWPLSVHIRTLRRVTAGCAGGVWDRCAAAPRSCDGLEAGVWAHCPRLTPTPCLVTNTYAICQGCGSRLGSMVAREGERPPTVRQTDASRGAHSHTNYLHYIVIAPHMCRALSTVSASCSLPMCMTYRLVQTHDALLLPVSEVCCSLAGKCMGLGLSTRHRRSHRQGD